MTRTRLFGEKVCPPLYRDTDVTRLLSKLQQALSNGDGNIGLGFSGDAGAGKTRAAYLALKRGLDDGKTVDPITGTQLHRLLLDLHGDTRQVRSTARERCRELRKVGMLLIDDLGKQKFTAALLAFLWEHGFHGFRIIHPVLICRCEASFNASHQVFPFLDSRIYT